MLDLRRLRLLRDLAHLGTIAAVAAANAYTPSAVSQQLTALQREAGVALLERSGRGVRLTPTGAALAEQTETVLAAVEAAEAILAAARTGLHGTVRIGAFPSAVRTLLPSALVTLGGDHPGLALAVTELDPAAVPAALRGRSLDIGLLQDYDVVPADPDPTVASVPLLDEPVFLATTSANADPTPDSGPTPATPDSGRADPVGRARNADWITGASGTLCHTLAVRVCQLAGFTPRVRHHADDFAAVLALVAAGQGVALVPRLGAVDPPAGVHLAPLPIRRRTRVGFRAGADGHPAVTACVAALRSAAAAHLDQPAAPQ